MLRSGPPSSGDLNGRSSSALLVEGAVLRDPQSLANLTWRTYLHELMQVRRTNLNEGKGD
jgi:hypothetical protein